MGDEGGVVAGAASCAKAIENVYNTAAAVNEATVLIILILPELGLNVEVASISSEQE